MRPTAPPFQISIFKSILKLQKAKESNFYFAEDLSFTLVPLSAMDGRIIVGITVYFLNQVLQIPYLLAAIVTNGYFTIDPISSWDINELCDYYLVLLNNNDDWQIVHDIAATKSIGPNRGKYCFFFQPFAP